MEHTLVTGGSGYLGKAFCRELLKTNTPLIITGRSEEKLLKTREELLKENPKAVVHCFACDLSDEADIRKLFSFIDENGLKLNRLINVAGVDTQKAFLKYDLDKLSFQIRVNLEATIEVTLEFLKRRGKRSEILTVSSLCSVTSVPYFAVYSATKSALNVFFYALSGELRDVKITTVLPGSIETRPDIIEDIKKQGFTGRLSKKSPEYVAKKSLAALKKGKPTFVPGFFNKVAYFFNKITPARLSRAVVRKKYKNKEKDAF